MKKKLFLILASLSLVGCSTPLSSLDHSKSISYLSEVVAANAKVEDSNGNIEYSFINGNINNTYAYNEYFFDGTYAANGILIIKESPSSTSGHIYSLFNNYIILSYVNFSDGYFTVKPVNNFGCFIQYYDYSYSKLKVIDCYGISITKVTSINFDVNYCDALGYSFENSLFGLTIDDHKNSLSYKFIYKQSNSGQYWLSCTESEWEAYLNPSDDNSSTEDGEIEKLYESINGLTVTKNDKLYTLYYSNKQLVSVFDTSTKEHKITYALPSDIDGLARIIGHQLIYQKKTKADDDSTDYDYKEDENKYLLHTYSLDLIEGLKEEIVFKGIIDSIEGVKDSTGYINLGIAKIKEILSDKTLGDTFEYIINGDGVLFDNVTGMQMDSFTCLSNGNYFNTKTKILYSSNVVPIVCLDGYSVTNFVAADLLVIGINGLCGAIDYSGIERLGLYYKSINTSYYDNGYFECIDQNGTKIINYSSNQATVVATIPNTYKKLAEGLYLEEVLLEDLGYTNYYVRTSSLIGFGGAPLCSFTTSGNIKVMQIHFPKWNCYYLCFFDDGMYLGRINLN